MAITPELRGTLSVINKATSPLRAVIRDLALMGRQFLETGEEGKRGGREAGEGAHEIARGAEHAEHAVERMGHSRGFLTLAGHVRILRGHLGGLNANLGEVQHSLAEFLPALGGLAVAGGLVGLVELTEKTAEVRGEMARTATSIGITTQQLVNLHTVAKLTDTPIESLDGAMQKLDKALGLAAIGKGKDTIKLLGAMHISLRDTHHQVRSAMDVFPQLAQAIMKTQSPALRMVIATKLLGKGSADLIPLMMRGKEAIEELSREAANLNYAPSEKESAGLEQFHENQVKLTTAVGGFRDAIGAKLGPVLAQIAPQWTALIQANRDWIATNIADAVKSLSDALLRINLKTIIADFKDWTGGIKDAADAFQKSTGMNPAVAAAAVALGLPLLGPLRAATDAAKSLSSALLLVGRVAFGPAIAAAANFAKALYLTRDAAFALDFALNANPIGAIIGGVALLGAAAYELWQHWSQVKTFFADLWNDVVDIFQGAWRKLKPIIDPIIKAAEKLGHMIPGLSGHSRTIDPTKPTTDPNVRGGARDIRVTPLIVPPPLPMGTGFPMLGRLRVNPQPDPPKIILPKIPTLPASGGQRNDPLQAPAAMPSIYDRRVPAANTIANVNGKVAVDINLSGAPAGVTVNATATGAAAAPKIRTGPNLPAGATLAR